MALNPFFSSGFRKSLIEGGNMRTLFDGGELHIYSGTQPTNADATEGAGTKLATVILPDASEEVTNGGFATDTDWTKGTGWTIAAGVASCDGTQIADSDLSQTTPTNAVVTGYEYEITYTVSNYSAGNVVAVVGGVEGTDRSANGTYTETITAGDTTPWAIRGDASFVGDIDDVSVVIHAFQQSVSSDGQIALNGLWKDTSADATGTAAWFRLYDSSVITGASTGAVRMDGTAGSGTFDLNMSTTSINITDPVTVNTFVYQLLDSDS